MQKNKNTSSDANIGMKKLNSYVSGSEFTISSIGKEDKDNIQILSSQRKIQHLTNVHLLKTNCSKRRKVKLRLLNKLLKVKKRKVGCLEFKAMLEMLISLSIPNLSPFELMQRL